MQIGDKLPEELGLNQDGVMLHASDFKGKKLALYFYPKDMTSGCTIEASNLRDNYDTLRQAGYEIVGVSVDSEASHKKFISKNDLPFQLISDQDHRLVNMFGVWAEKKMYGKSYMGTLRTTFLFDDQGILIHIITPKEIKVSEHASQTIKYGEKEK